MEKDCLKGKKEGVIVLDVNEHMLTVVRLMRWRMKKKSLRSEALPPYVRAANEFFTQLPPNYFTVLNLRFRQTVCKTELFRLSPGVTTAKLIDGKVGDLHDWAGAPLQVQELSKEIEDRRMPRDAALKVGATVQTPWEFLVWILF